MAVNGRSPPSTSRSRAAKFPPINDEDFAKLVADIKANGLHFPIVTYQGKVLDGNNRYRACVQAKVEPKFVPFKGDNAAAQALVISANIHRRHLSRDDRNGIIATLLKADPGKSNRQIAEQTKADHKTVGIVRDQMEATGEIPQLDSTTGKDGKTRMQRKAKSKAGGAKGDKQTITFQKAINTKTALNAYSVLEEHLLDALQDVCELTDFSQAEDNGQRTIEKLQERLAEMAPEEEGAAALRVWPNAPRSSFTKAIRRSLKRSHQPLMSATRRSSGWPSFIRSIHSRMRKGGRSLRGGSAQPSRR
jgi:ParB-like chromosome segregation protein Spo0J